MKNMRLKTKLLFSFAIILMGTIILAATAFIGTARLSQEINMLAQKSVPNVKYVQQIQTQIRTIRMSLLEALAENNDAGIRSELEEANTAFAQLDTLISEYKQNATVDASLIASFETNLAQATGARNKIMPLIEQNMHDTNDEAFDMYFESTHD